MKKRVLIVDDSGAIRSLVSFILETAGYNVIEAVNGRDALSKLGDNEPQMIITDLRMPNMDGIEFAMELRKKKQYEHLPLVMLTSEFQGYKSTEGEMAGVHEWMAKPFIARKLLKTVDRLFSTQCTSRNSEAPINGTDYKQYSDCN
jgi:two-component system chemotaxis response regulator CheY